MKNLKRLLAVLLAVVMCLSCLAGLSFADASRDGKGKLEPRTDTAQPAEGRGFKSNDFQLRNSYQYADDELVTAIVLLTNAAPAEVAEAERAAAATRVAAQHNTLRNALRNAGISYALEFEYDSLLNGMSITVAYGDLDKIAAMAGVKAVYIANWYAAPVVEPSTRMASSNVMTGVADFQTAGYKGEGMLIAVLDTGITPGHEAFGVYGDTLANAALSEEDAKDFIAEKEYGTYISQKIPFAYDYFDQDNDATDDKSGHGTHVSGIAAGYAETEEGEITFCGTAPYAQIVAMKVFSSGSTNGTNSGIYFAALEDCYELGVDVINMSLGAQNGFTYDFELEDEVFGNVYQILEDNGIICSVAAGNEYSMAEYSSSWAGPGYVTSDYADYGVVGSPSTYDGNMSVASVENAEFPGNVLVAGDKQFPYYDSDGTQFLEAMGGKEDVEYVVIDGYGTPADFMGVDVEGKIALISRGDITFQEKVQNAAAAGACAALIYNNQDGVIYMSIDTYYVPAASITEEAGEYLISIAEMPEEEEPEEGGEAAAPAVRGEEAAPAVRGGNYVALPLDVKYGVRAHAAAEDLIYGCYFETEDELDGWQTVDADGDGYDWGWTTSDLKAYEGNGVIYSESYHNNESGSGGTALHPDNWAISPAISLDGIEEATLSLWAIGQDASYAAEKFAIYAGISNEPEEMTKIGGDFTTTGDYKQFLADLSDFAGETIYIAIRHYNVTDEFILNVDQFEVIKGIIEPEPEPVIVTGVVQKGWYFESEDEVADWTFVDKDGDGDNWYVIDFSAATTNKAYEGYGALTSASYINDVGALTPDNWAITPAIDLTGIDDAKLSLFYAGQDASYAAEPLQVYVGLSADPDAMTAVSDEVVATGEYQQLVVDLSDYAGETIYIGIRHFDVTDMFRLNIDQVEILTPPEPVIRPVGTVSFPEEAVILENPEGWQMSSFSSWGVTPSLTLKPQISGIGGDVLSASFLTTDGYELMSGTSMATPNLTGIMALVSEYIDANIGKGTSLGENPFTDVGDDDWYTDPVLWAVGEGITTGTNAEGTLFSPTMKCTRAQVVTFLYRAYKGEKVENPETTFSDVPAGSWYEDAVNWAVSKGITTGTGNGKFSPDAECSRAQVVTFLYRASGDKVEAEAGQFTDVAEGSWYAEAVTWAVKNEITTGTGNGKFSPDAVCDRSQVVTFLFRALADLTGEPLTKPERAELAEKLTQSTALILTDTYGDAYSPRKQGAGLANMTLLQAANAYVDDPICNLFDNADGEFEIKFTVKDLYGKGGTYTLNTIVQSDYPARGDLNEDGTPETYNTLTALTLAIAPYTEDGQEYPADVEIEAPETVTVPRNGEVEVTVKIKLTDATKALLDQLYPNGTYVEGFVLLTAGDEEGISEMIHATYVGFYGDWTKGEILEPHDWRDVVDINNFLNYTAADEEGNTYADYGYTYLDFVPATTDVSIAYALNYDYLTQGQLYGGFAGDNLFGYDSEMEYSDARIAIAPGTGITDTLYMMPYNLRNVRHLIMIATNAETGELYYVDDTEYLPKAYYDTDYAAWSNTGTFIYDGTDAEGNVLPDGTKVNLTYYANLAYGEDALGAIIGEEGDYSKLLEEAKDYVVWEIPVTIDLKAPEVLGYAYDEETNKITVTAKDDNYVAAIYMEDTYGDTIGAAYFGEDEAGAEVSATFDYPEGEPYVTFYVEDYATNEGSGTGFAGDPVYVTITFSHPEGTELVGGEEEVVDVVGMHVVPPVVEGETDKGEFAGFWTMEDFGDMDEDTLVFYYYFGLIDLYFTEGDYITLTEDMDGAVFYPVYYVEEIVQEGISRTDEPIDGWYFESDDELDGWTFVDADGDGFNWERYTESADAFIVYEGDGLIASASYDDDTWEALFPDNWAITPAIDLTAVDEASVSLWAAGESSSYADEVFAIYAGETADPAAMTKLTDDITANDYYTNYVADLSAYAGKTVYVAIRHYNVTDMYYLNVDQVEVFDSVVTPDQAEIIAYYYTTQPNGSAELDTADLEAALAEAMAIVAADYTADSYAVLMDAMEKAERVLDDDEATQDDVDEALAQLEAALEGLVPAESNEDVYMLATELKDGDKVIIYNADAGKAISCLDSDAASNPERYRFGVDATVTDGKITEISGDAVWTVEIDAEKGIAFKDSEGRYLSVPSNYANLVLDSDCKYWTVSDAATADSVYIISTESKGSSGDLRGIEYYQGKFTTYYASETNLTNSQAAFALQLFVLDVG